MKEAVVGAGPKVKIIDSSIPEPKDDEVLIKVIVSGSNPKDWKLPEIRNDWIMNQGDDIAGIVEKVGDKVYEFKPGDRVAAFHRMVTPHGSYAEFAIAPAHTTFHIPKETSFEEAATLPLAAMTAAIGLFQRLALPEPWAPASISRDIPLVIYGASSAVGIYALQLALRSNIHPLICVAGRAKDYVEGFIDRSKGDAIVDYRDGDEAVVKGIKAALNGRPLYHALDAVSEGTSAANLAQVLSADDGKAKVTFVLPTAMGGKDIPEGVEQTTTQVGDAHGDAQDFAFAYFRYMARGLQEGWFKGQRVEVVPGGLGGIEGALKNLKEGKASAVKYVFRIAETEGVSN